MNTVRSYFAEFLGTFILVFIGTGTIVYQTLSQTGSLLAVALAFALAVIVSVYAFGDISDAHFNPAVSLAMAINKRMSWTDFAGYVVAQLLGAIVASLGVLAFIAFYLKTDAGQNIVSSAASQGTNLNVKYFVQNVGLGQTDFPQGLDFYALLLEIVLTFILVLLVLNLTGSQKVDKGFNGLVVGFTIAGLILVGGNLDGASLNPVRSIAPALFAQGHSLAGLWVYIVGPLLGGVFAALVSRLMLNEKTSANANSKDSMENTTTTSSATTVSAAPAAKKSTSTRNTTSTRSTSSAKKSTTSSRKRTTSTSSRSRSKK